MVTSAGSCGILFFVFPQGPFEEMEIPQRLNTNTVLPFSSNLCLFCRTTTLEITEPQSLRKTKETPIEQGKPLLQIIQGNPNEKR